MLWDYIHHLIDSWDSECVILGDFNEVCHEEESSWKKAACMESNAIVKLKKKLQFLKCSIKQWVKEDKTNANATKLSIQSRLSNLDKTIDQGRGTNDTVNDRPNLLKELHDLNSFTSLDLAQKEKIHWAIEGDENSKYFYGIINKKRSQMAIRGVLAEGEWMVEPAMVKREFLDHFSNGFATLISPKNFIQSQFPKCLSLYQNEIFERIATYDEIKKAVRWDFLDEVLHKFGFGDKWRGCLSSSMGSILVNDSPTSEFQFHKGLKKGDPLSHFLFILIMESLHVSFENVLTTGLYKGIRLDDSLSLSHLFYADDVVFVGKWDKLKFSTIVNVLKWFFMASGLKINIHKSKLMGIGIPQDVVASTANSIGCAILTFPFNYLRVKVGGNMSRLISWDEVIAKISSRLSKWKLKTLSIGGRYTLTKPVLSSLPLHYFSIFKVPKGILNKMESFRRNFFNGVDISENKMSLIGWKHILASKKNGGLGISSLFALNRAILFKWICHFITNGSSLWSRVIKAFYGNRGAIDIIHNSSRRNGEETSFWDDVWTSDSPLKLMFLRLYSLELDKTCSVAIKVRDTSLIASFRRPPRGGIEVDQLRLLGDIISPIKYWGTIQKDLYDFVNLFFASCVMPNGANSSFFTLIPKVNNPTLITPLTFAPAIFLWQGDPLSPFLFFWVMDGLLIAFLRKKWEMVCYGVIIKVSILYNVPILFYADDVIITTNWNARDMENIIRVLHVFYLASGLKINIYKSNFYGIGVNEDELVWLAMLVVLQVLKLSWSRRRFLYKMVVASRGFLANIVGTLISPLEGHIRSIILIRQRLSYHWTVFNNGHWSWNWSRTNLGVRNLAYLCDMLNEIGQLNIDVNEDTCTWSLCPNGTFTVKDARYRIDQNIFPSDHATTWDKSFPHLKVLLVDSFYDWIIFGMLSKVKKQGILYNVRFSSFSWLHNRDLMKFLGLTGYVSPFRFSVDGMVRDAFGFLSETGVQVRWVGRTCTPRFFLVWHLRRFEDGSSFHHSLGLVWGFHQNPSRSETGGSAYGDGVVFFLLPK
ncbi:RNA-directed DNA polymerase, eukaryota [Tanacetum coccineum]